LCPRFMEFEAAEEMENPKLQLMMGLHSQPPPGSLSLDPQRPPAPEVSKQPGSDTLILPGSEVRVQVAKGDCTSYGVCFQGYPLALVSQKSHRA
jgi:hypothetical protein